MERHVAAYKRRRAQRLCERYGVRYDSSNLDSGLGWLFGLATDLGIKTKGMEIPEIFKAVNEKRAQKGLEPVGHKGNVSGKKGSFKQTSRKGPEVNQSLVSNAKEEAKKNMATSYKTASGANFPKPKAGAKFDNSVMSGVEKSAKDLGKEKEFDDIVKSLKPTDYVYMKDPVTGDQVASVPGLAQRFDKTMTGRSEECQRIYDQKIKKGAQISRDMIDAVNGIGCRLSGLENCFKGGDSTSRKISTKRSEAEARGKETKTDEGYTAGFGDIIRFTALCDHDDIAETVTKLESAMQKKGYELNERDNKWVTGDGSYKGVHIEFISPTGERFEVQVHSTVALAFKNKGHRYYDNARVEDVSTAKGKKRHDAAIEKCKSIWKTCPIPKGIEDLKPIPKKKR